MPQCVALRSRNVLLLREYSTVSAHILSAAVFTVLAFSRAVIVDRLTAQSTNEPSFVLF